MARRVVVAAAPSQAAWLGEWPAAPSVEGLLDLVLDDAYAYLDALERRKGALRPGGVAAGAAGREGPVRLSVELGGFAPEDVSVRLDGRKLRLTAKRENSQQAPDGCCSRDYREVMRELLLPEDADLDGLSCALGADGQLRIQAPRRRQERVVPIQRGGGGGGGEPEKKAEGGEKK